MLMITGGAVGIITCNVKLFGTKQWDMGKMCSYEFKMGTDLLAGFKKDDTRMGAKDTDVR